MNWDGTFFIGLQLKYIFDNYKRSDVYCGVIGTLSFGIDYFTITTQTAKDAITILIVLIALYTYS